MAGRARKKWSELSPAYRARLTRQGVTAKKHSTANLLSARGHKPVRSEQKGAAPRVKAERLTAGEATMGDIRDLERWAASKLVPSWIPRDWSVDMKASASLIDLPPGSWGKVHFDPRADGDPWTMTITPKGATLRPDGTSRYDRVYEIPGGGGRDQQGARELLDWLAYGNEVPDRLEWDVGGTV